VDSILEIKFNKSLRYLDKGKIDDGKKLLEEIIEISKNENKKIYYIKASTIIGEINFDNGKIIEAKKHLIKALETKLEDENDDIVDYEKRICNELLIKILEIENNGVRGHSI
jgi:tetratricopeptide (TPR) repeat protein